MRNADANAAKIRRSEEAIQPLWSIKRGASIGPPHRDPKSGNAIGKTARR
jgi:hypothetical protein